MLISSHNQSHARLLERKMPPSAISDPNSIIDPISTFGIKSVTLISDDGIVVTKRWPIQSLVIRGRRSSTSRTFADEEAAKKYRCSQMHNEGQLGAWKTKTESFLATHFSVLNKRIKYQPIFFLKHLMLLIYYGFLNDFSSPVSWCCKIHRLHICRGLKKPNECPG